MAPPALNEVLLPEAVKVATVVAADVAARTEPSVPFGFKTPEFLDQ